MIALVQLERFGMFWALIILGLARHRATRADRLAWHPMRRAILEAVRELPGILLSRLRLRIGCAPGTIQYHLRLLEKEGFVASVRGPRRRWIFPTKTATADRFGLALLRSGRTWDIVQALLQRSGISERALVDLLAINRRVLRGCLRRLTDEGLVVEHEVQPTAYSPSSRLRHLAGTYPDGGGRPAMAPKPGGSLVTAFGRRPKHEKSGDFDPREPTAPAMPQPALQLPP